MDGDWDVVRDGPSWSDDPDDIGSPSDVWESDGVDNYEDLEVVAEAIGDGHEEDEVLDGVADHGIDWVEETQHLNELTDGAVVLDPATGWQFLSDPFGAPIEGHKLNVDVHGSDEFGAYWRSLTPEEAEELRWRFDPKANGGWRWNTFGGDFVGFQSRF